MHVPPVPGGLANRTVILLMHAAEPTTPPCPALPRPYHGWSSSSSVPGGRRRHFLQESHSTQTSSTTAPCCFLPFGIRGAPDPPAAHSSVLWGPPGWPGGLKRRGAAALRRSQPGRQPQAELVAAAQQLRSRGLAENARPQRSMCQARSVRFRQGDLVLPCCVCTLACDV